MLTIACSENLCHKDNTSPKPQQLAYLTSITASFLSIENTCIIVMAVTIIN